MIEVLFSVLLLLSVAILAVAVGALRSSRRSEVLGEDRYALLRDQQERLELLREERRTLIEELERQSQESQQFRELLGQVGPQLVEGLKQAQEGSLEDTSRTEALERERLRLEEELQQLKEELERERQNHLEARRRAEGLEQEHEQLAKVRQEAERLGQEHQRLTEELEKERGGHQEVQARAENLQQERLQLEEQLWRLNGELEQERQERSEVQRRVEQLEQEGRERSGIGQQAERAALDLQRLRADFDRERGERLEAQRRTEQLEQERLGLKRELRRSKDGPGTRSRWRRPALIVGVLLGSLILWLISLVVGLNLLSS
jgi:chromosome segregation ATPase